MAQMQAYMGKLEIWNNGKAEIGCVGNVRREISSSIDRVDV
jgi:hypothetical protein